MKTVRAALIVLACSVPLLASAQWQWVDKSGRKVFSDQAPPPDISADRILKSPGGRTAVRVQPEVATGDTAATAAVAKPTGKDPVLEKKLKEAEAAEAAKKKAEDEKFAAAQSQNCARAKASKATFDSGIRIMHTNSKGEKEFMDDAQRATEMRRLDEVIARDCR